jgi:DNA-binding NtrC family response regulator
MERMRLLLVDDDQKFLSITKKSLAKQGHIVQTASTGSEVFKKLQAQNIHVVVLDVKMSGMSGVEILKKIKKSSPLAQVIMLAEHGRAGGAAESLKFGAIDYLIKPVSIAKLLQKTQEAFEKRKCLEQKIRDIQIRVLEFQFN